MAQTSANLRQNWLAQMWTRKAGNFCKAWDQELLTLIPADCMLLFMVMREGWLYCRQQQLRKPATCRLPLPAPLRHRSHLSHPQVHY